MATGFFSIGLAEWRQACEIGLNPAVAFLVLACGTGRSNQTSKWSANAVQTYGGIRWERAKPAIEQLIKAGLITLGEGSTTARPVYKLRISEDRIWLPKTIVTPIAGEVPVINRLRQVQDVMVLRLFVELYHAQNLAADGGIARSIYCRKYKKQEARDVGNMIYLGFDVDTTYVTWGSPVTDVHKGLDAPTRGDQFFSRMKTIIDMGLIQEATYLFESAEPEAEILFPLSGPEPEESGLYGLASEVVEANLAGGSALLDNYDYVVPVYRHQRAATLFGIFRMRFRAQTANTGAWYAGLKDKSEDARAMFRSAML